MSGGAGAREGAIDPGAVSSRATRAHPPARLPLRTLAPAKINLGLFVGPTRGDGRHELVSAMQPISLADELLLEDAPHAGADEVLCPGVRGENLAARAIALFREATGWSHGPLRLSIAKRIPVAAGLAGGSADAGGTLRLARAASGLGDEDTLAALAARLGADVPAQLAPTRVLAGGAGELLEPLPAPAERLGVLVLPQAHGLSTADVYAAADALGRGRDRRELELLRSRLRAALGAGEPLPAARGAGGPPPVANRRAGALPPAVELLANDLQAACLALSPAAGRALAEAERAGADVALVSGSGPTALGLFAGPDGPERARAAATALAGRAPAPIAAEAVGATFAGVAPAGT